METTPRNSNQEKHSHVEARLQKLTPKQRRADHIIAGSFIRYTDDDHVLRIKFKGVFLNEQGRMPVERMGFGVKRKNTKFLSNSNFLLACLPAVTCKGWVFVVTTKPWHKNDHEGTIYNHSRLYRQRSKFKIQRITNQVIIDQYWQTNRKDMSLIALKAAFNGEALMYLTRRYEKRGGKSSCFYKFSFFKVEDSGHVEVTNDGFEMSSELPDDQGVIKEVDQVYVTGKLGNIVILRFNKVKLLTLTFSPNGTKKLLNKSMTEIGMCEEDCWAYFWIRQFSPDSKFVFVVYTSDVVYVKKMTDDNRLEYRAGWSIPYSLQTKRGWGGIPLSGTFSEVCCYSETKLLALVSLHEKKRDFLKLYALDYCDEDKSFEFYPVSDKRFRRYSYGRRLYRHNGEVFMKTDKDEIFRIDL